ncbi:MAG: LysR family transcriptional regulator, partial [Nitrososphaeria archaeon]|nr:LysR family transcriptional regulator [Nitrososphaeria archaeon]
MNEVLEKVRFSKDLSAKISIEIESGGGEGFSERDARLFKAIKRFGSIFMASKHVREDYGLSWKRIDALEKTFQCKLVERALGGVGGGGARLTVEAEILLQKYLLAVKKLKSIEGSKLLEADLKIYGSHCPALEALVEQAEERFKNFYIEYISVGSMVGLKLVVGKYADLSGIHLYDEKTGKYNIFLFEDSCIGEKIAIIRGYKREQGIVTRGGNPKNICSIEDLLRKDIVFVNRN